MSATEVWSGDYLWRQFEAALLNPIRAFRPRYLPLLMVYFAYGAPGLIAVAESFWVKKALTSRRPNLPHSLYGPRCRGP